MTSEPLDTGGPLKTTKAFFDESMEMLSGTPEEIMRRAWAKEKAGADKFFDFDLAIAAMPQHNGVPDTELLRDRYPELRSMFDELDNLRADAGEMEAKATVEWDGLKDRLDDIVDVIAACRDMLDVIRKMDGANGVKTMLADVSEKLDIEVSNYE